MSKPSQRVLITGAASGIGQATALAFAQSGARLALSDFASMDDTAARLQEANVDFQCATVDVRQEASVRRWVTEGVAFLGQIDVAVHCAGVLTYAPLLDTRTEDFDAVIATNLKGTFLVGREVLRCMHAQGGRRLINIASDLSHIGRKEFSAYCASKAAVLSLTKTWALEFAPQVLVNAICPGPIDTAMLGADNMSEEWRNAERDIPMARFGDAAEVAAAAVFLASAGATFITGQGIGVNGGSVM